jgi:hypothetical protein
MLTEWRAEYSDGSWLDQYNEDGAENKYVNIDRSRLAKFFIFQNKKVKLVVHLDKPERRLIYRRRASVGVTGGRGVVYLVGWQETVDGKNFQCVCFLFDDGHVEVLPGFKEDKQPFYGINLIKDEL